MTYLADRFKTSSYIDGAIQDYYVAATTPDMANKGRLTRYLTHLVSSKDGSFTPEHYRALVLPALGLYLFGYSKPIVFIVIVNALKSTECPTDVLAVACRCETAAYRRAAARNPSCLEEDRVYAVLFGDSVGDVYA